jgi:drug/metabolite transporter (DMT)-like permease
MRGHAAALAAFAIWGLASSVLLRHIPLPGPVVTCLGGAFGAVFTFMIVWRKHGAGVFRALRGRAPMFIKFAAAAAASGMTFHWSVKLTTVANAVLTHALQPLLTCLIFLPIFNKEKVDRRGFASLIVGIVGLAVLLWPQLSWNVSWLGIGLGIASAAFFSWFIIQMPGFDDVPPEIVVFWEFCFGSMLLAPFAAWQWEGSLSATTVGWLALFGLMIGTLANLLYFYASRHAPLSHVATLAYFEPVVCIAAAALFLGEPLTSSAAAGGALVLGSGLIVMTGKKKTTA